MTHPPSGFSDVDRADDPERFVRYVDALRAIPGIAVIASRLAAFVRPAAGETVVDLGCGLGDDARAILDASPGACVVGFDASHRMLGLARTRHAAVLGKGLSFARADAYELPLGSGASAGVAGIVASRLLQHLAHAERAVGEMLRTLGPTGRIALCDPDWRTARLVTPCEQTARTIEAAFLEVIARPTIGADLEGIVRSQAQLLGRRVDVEASTVALSTSDAAQTRVLFSIDRLLARLSARGVIDEGAVLAFGAAMAEGALAGSVTTHVVLARLSEPSRS